MSLKFSPPGSRRVRGVQRAQLQALRRIVASQLRYNDKQAARVPPVTYLTNVQKTNLTAASISADQLLQLVN